MSAADIDGVATFYNLIRRKPVARHVALICDSVSCWIMGCERVRDQLCTRLGTTLGGSTADGRFTLLPIVCLGACDHAPAMMIDGEWRTQMIKGDNAKINYGTAAFPVDPDKPELYGAGYVTGNIVAMTKDLGSNGIVGLIALGIILWLFSKRQMS